MLQLLLGGLDDATGASVQGLTGVNAPALVLVSVTIPVGVDGVPKVELSVTVNVQVLACPTTVGAAQLAVVVVLRRSVADRLALPELPAWTVLPP